VGNVSLHQFLVIYSWFPLAALLLFLLLIARFYQKFSGQRTYFWWFLVPLVGFGAAAVRYASVDTASGDMLAALLTATAGAVLLALGQHLYRVMLLQKP
jgi:hypothetical protein